MAVVACFVKFFVNVCGKQGAKRNPCQVFFWGDRYFINPRLLNKINVLGYLGSKRTKREHQPAKSPAKSIKKERLKIVAQLFGLGGKITA